MTVGVGRTRSSTVGGVLRRWVAAGLAIAGVLVLIRVVQQHDGDVGRSGVLGALTVGGLLVNVLSAARAHLALRWSVRVAAFVFGAVVVGGLFGLSLFIDAELAAAGPKVDQDIRLALRQWQVTLQWTALGAGYLVVSLALLPGPARRSAPHS